MDFFDFFTDPVLRGPTLGCMLMCLAAALSGVIIFLRKQSLLGESLSHAAYPGVILGAVFGGSFGLQDDNDLRISIAAMVGAFLSALAGLYCIRFLEKKLRVKSDSALCLILSTFFGIGLTLASHVQFSHSGIYRQIQAYLFGQAATMTDVHIQIYSILAIVIILTLCFFYKELQTMTFDPQYAKSLGIPVNRIESLILFLVVLAIVIGIRSVGVVLMSAMLIIPAISARQFSHHLPSLFILAAIIGVCSGFLGNFLSILGSSTMEQAYPGLRLSLPTGPSIVLVASSICLFALLFAPERGVLTRLIRIALFRYHCLCENMLKTIWRIDANGDVSLQEIAKYQGASHWYLKWILNMLSKRGWLIKRDSSTYQLTHEGRLWAAKIVRLHRLWEVYLANYLGVGAERVHRNAEEMEHIITPELEQELTLLLNNPQLDPHHQPIPPKEAL